MNKTIAFVLLLFSAPVRAEIMSLGDFSVNGSAITPATVVADTVTATGAGFSIQATNGNVYAKYGVNASTAVITYVQASSITTTGGLNAWGNSGFGTLAPATKLHMSSGTLTVDGTGAEVSVGGRSGLTPTLRLTAGNAQSKIQTEDGAYNLDITNMANVGATDGIYESIRFFTGNNTAVAKMNLTRLGNLGVGSIGAPASKIHMSSGTLTIDGNTQLAVNIGGTFKPWSRTKAQVDTLAAGTVGEYIHVTDTTLPGLCVSTGTLASQWRKVESATLGCGTNN